MAPSRIRIHPALCHGKLIWMGGTCQVSHPFGFQLGCRSEGEKGKVRYLLLQLLPCEVTLVWLCPLSEGCPPYDAAGFPRLPFQVPCTAPSPCPLKFRFAGKALGEGTIFCAPPCAVWVCQVFCVGTSLMHMSNVETKLSFFCFVLNGCTCCTWKFPGQRLNPSCSCDLCHRCGNARSFDPCSRPGMEPAPLQ